MTKPVIIGVGGPVGSGKTTLLESITKDLSKKYQIAVITNDIYTKVDEEYMKEHSVLPDNMIMGIETGGCPHTAIREDASMNLAAIDELEKRNPNLDLIFVESGGDNLAATFSPDLVDFSIYIIGVPEGEKIPRKAGQGMIKSDLFIINKTDLAPYVGADLKRMKSDTEKFRDDDSFIFTDLRKGENVKKVEKWIERNCLLVDPK